VFSHKANLNLVLEFLEYDLEMLIKNKSVVFSAGDVKAWMGMCLKGLRHVHSLYILHRVFLRIDVAPGVWDLMKDV
jgi:cyclin-dependent kinase 7